MYKFTKFISTYTDYGHQSKIGVPSFEWIDKATLKIVYPNGKSDVAMLKNYNPIPAGPNERAEDLMDLCIFNGYLKEENDVYIVLAGCPFTNNFQARPFIIMLIFHWQKEH